MILLLVFIEKISINNREKQQNIYLREIHLKLLINLLEEITTDSLNINKFRSATSFNGRLYISNFTIDNKIDFQNMLMPLKQD